MVQNNKDQKRCVKCVLPDSLPGSNFNSAGECAWCQTGFPNYVPEGEKKLQLLLENNKSNTGAADCLVGVSGGKDSTYVLFALKRKFGMKVEAFTYVHDGLTDFALQNAKETCRILDVKHHELSLPNHAHLKSFKSFFEAWVESEEPVAAAMTCVACKHLHLIGTRLAKERQIPMVVWSMCPLEVPPFIPTQAKGETKVTSNGMTGLSVLLGKNIIAQEKFRQAFFENISTCLFGCLAYRPSTKYLQIRYKNVKHVYYFDYMDWHEGSIVKTLKEHTSWSIPKNIVTDWHSDCLFNVFKEYMFQKMLGASYTDAFLSNQIRHGLITREQGWEKLIKSKAYYSDELLKTLPAVGLEHLRSKCDVSCFDITS
jgi:glucosamine--fructose-6-phosphate aminotransferase (isomerizing)